MNKENNMMNLKEYGKVICIEIYGISTLVEMHCQPLLIVHFLQTNIVYPTTPRWECMLLV